MSRLKKRIDTEINAGSMADIAFLLLIFFLVTTTISSDKGIIMKLPPDQKKDIPFVKIPERNLFKIMINSKDELLIENELAENLEGIRRQIKTFILNPKKDKDLAISPQKAIVSIKTNRGTSYDKYISALDEVQAAYYEIYAERVGITSEAFRKLNRKDPAQRKIYEKGRKDMPMNISIAKPSK